MIVPVMSLWLPILLSAVFVFVASSVIHMVLPYHKGDFRKMPAEDDVMEALRKFNIPPGDYMMPCAGGSQEMKTPAFAEKMKKGPVMTATVLPTGRFSMTSNLVQWFIYCAVVSAIAAYVAGRAVGPGTSYLAVFRFAGVTAFACYALAQWQNSIWYKRAWSTTIKNTFDGLIYGMLTAGTFGWLWPR